MLIYVAYRKYCLFSWSNQKIMIVNRGPQTEQNSEVIFFDYTGAMCLSGLDVEQVYYLIMKI